jgi:ferredoxin
LRKILFLPNALAIFFPFAAQEFTAEHAETAEKKIKNNLCVLCGLCGKSFTDFYPKNAPPSSVFWPVLPPRTRRFFLDTD